VHCGIAARTANAGRIFIPNGRAKKHLLCAGNFFKNHKIGNQKYIKAYKMKSYGNP
jgi:hypothetical protein